MADATQATAPESTVSSFMDEAPATSDATSLPPEGSPPAPGEETTSAAAPTTEASPAKDAPPATKEAAPPAAPLVLKPPEGLDAKALEPYVAKAQELGLKAEQAQALLDWQAQQAKANAAAQQAAWKKADLEQAAALLKDPEVGGEKRLAAQQATQRALKAAPRNGPEFAKLMKQAGLDNHPTVARYLAEVGKAFKDDSLGGAPAATGPTLTERDRLKLMYPKSPEMFSKE